jgi:CubicO group peptidase (beta-lactamase class C family)
MKRNNTKLAILMFVTVLLLSGCMPRLDKDAPIEEKIKQVEEGLLPGHAFPPWKKASIEERMKHYQIPGVSIAVIEDFKLSWAKGYGVMEAGGNRPVTTASMFQALGVSIRLTHFLAMHAVEKGLIGPDEDVNRKLVSWKIPENLYTQDQKVTLRRLLRLNYSGFNHFGLTGYEREGQLPSLLQILEGQPPAGTPPVRVVNEPGTCLCLPGGNLSLTGYIVVQQLMEDISKETFHELARRAVLNPLGMKDSTFEQPLPQSFQHRAATGHENGGVPLKGKWLVYPETAAKGLWTTPSDLARFTIEFMNVWRGNSNKVVSPFALFQTFNPKSTYFNLNSGSGGFYCSHVFNVKTGQGVVVMINSNNNGYAFKQELLHSVFVTNRWVWGNFIKRKEMIYSLLLTTAAALIALIFLLGGALFLLRRGKRTRS